MRAQAHANIRTDARKACGNEARLFRDDHSNGVIGIADDGVVWIERFTETP